ncbi:type I methionyl aminopeptidase [Dialister micraerophilus]|uniref:type I methionyl aminopeptidase n=1 Tax=Dialister micraerophilus TaxID=309120 RepID=UPI0023F3BEED|nr:type I methionyl aminopeptidase [Dialister micraerophilus]
MITIRTPKEIEKIAAASKLTADTLSMLAREVKAGISTLDLDKMAEEFIRANGGIPACKGYEGYPATLCTSVNEVVVHGIPSAKRILRKGDIISIDLVVEVDGYKGDSCITVPVGRTSKKNMKLIEVTENALFAGIKQAVVGNHVGDIGHAIESFVKPYGYGVLREYVGHGIGTEMHEEPEIPNYGTPGHGPRLEEGMCICIEPMITMGSEKVYTLKDGWSVLTKDGLPSAHMEHTLVITEEGPEILTLRN